MTSSHGANTARSYHDLLLLIVRLIDDADRPVVVGIDGRSGSGKTTIAQQLASDLRPRDVACFEVEDFIGGWHALTRDIGRVGEIVADIQVDGQSDAPPWDWVAEQWTEPISVPDYAHADVVLVVGCGSTSAHVRPHLNVTVWIDVDADVRRQRVEARDPYDWSDYWDVWAAQENALLAEMPSDKVSDIIFQPYICPTHQ